MAEWKVLRGNYSSKKVQIRSEEDGDWEGEPGRRFYGRLSRAEITQKLEKTTTP